MRKKIQELESMLYQQRQAIESLGHKFPDNAIAIEELFAGENRSHLTTRITNALRSENILTLWDLLSKRQKNLLGIPDFWRKSLDKVVQVLKERGITLLE